MLILINLSGITAVSSYDGPENYNQTRCNICGMYQDEMPDSRKCSCGLLFCFCNQLPSCFDEHIKQTKHNNF